MYLDSQPVQGFCRARNQDHCAKVVRLCSIASVVVENDRIRNLKTVLKPGKASLQRPFDCVSISRTGEKHETYTLEQVGSFETKVEFVRGRDVLASSGGTFHWIS
jgi:hypothetical protein